MLITFTALKKGKIKKTPVTCRKTALSVLIGGLCCSAAPAWADCNVDPKPNENGGVNVICEGPGNTFNPSSVSGTNNNVVIIQGEGTTVDLVSGGNGSTVIGNTVTLSDNSRVHGDVYGAQGARIGDGDVTVTGNTVTLSGSSSAGDSVYGGSGHSSGSGDVKVTNNAIIFSDNSSVSGIYGGQGVGNGDVTVTGNTVTLNDSSHVEFGIYGGFGFGDATDQ